MEKRNAFAAVITEAVARVHNGALLAVFARKDFTRKDILDSSDVMSESTPHKQVAIYMRDHNGFPDTPACEPLILCGSPNDVATRCCTYRDTIKARGVQKRHQSIIVQKAKYVSGRIICALPDDFGKDSVLLKTVETIFSMLLETQRPAALGLDHASLNSLIPYARRKLEDDDKEHSSSINATMLLRKVTDSAKLLSSWPGGCSRRYYNLTTDHLGQVKSLI